ncbi:hypothetical protein LEP1GSC185_1510 [Leptospira licerasiae serovar Varillal str. VAR 010]|uniref:Uncharacterized protein n=1 Tax=Leptospira licerasiae str. MMD4847 TaxID=1049971 RepID=A0ABN0H685_9LEPT|nr:hypothetical protein LEP1GSC185_1510 [Leptospira licerasiae serovar Varillal str. VAR 010]EJZ41076.1 hypothetical protein LEP1GSC178_0773 [Leptospira licerasiae str. MMD4847]
MSTSPDSLVAGTGMKLVAVIKENQFIGSKSLLPFFILY